MGEYAKYQGESVKIGTCESMYYLRWEQAHLVTPEPGNVNPLKDRAELRFRFPFPAEDGTEPGAFDYPLPDLIASYPAGLPAEHDKVLVETPSNGQHNSRRMSTWLPCPMVAPDVWHTYVKDYKPAVRISYQGWRGDGVLAVIVTCAYCDGMWNLPEWSQAELLVASIRSDADKLRACGEHRIAETRRIHGEDCGDGLGESEIRKAAELHLVADRITTGYLVAVTS